MQGQPQPVTRIIAVKNYFFESEGLSVVAAEWKKLTDEDKQELAEGAARELGVELKPDTPVQ